jgi:hypothetical protein
LTSSSRISAFQWRLRFRSRPAGLTESRGGMGVVPAGDDFAEASEPVSSQAVFPTTARAANPSVPRQVRPNKVPVMTRLVLCLARSRGVSREGAGMPSRLLSGAGTDSWSTSCRGQHPPPRRSGPPRPGITPCRPAIPAGPGPARTATARLTTPAAQDGPRAATPTPPAAAHPPAPTDRRGVAPAACRSCRGLQSEA